MKEMMQVQLRLENLKREDVILLVREDDKAVGFADTLFSIG